MKLIDSRTERTTAATDVILGAAAAGAGIYLHLLARSSSWRISLWSWSFGLIALSAACGAAYHGLALPEAVRKALWQAVTVCLGMAISLFLVAVVYDAAGADAAARAFPLMLAAGLSIFGVSRMLPGLFLVFILYEALALLIAFAVYLWLAASGTLRGAGWMAAGIAVSLIAAAIQPVKRLRVACVWEIDRNGIFHLVQVIGIVLLCVGLSRA
jgi:TM2 domain-containing membrane protein YozV